MTLFDAYVIVDWSANSKPKSGKDSIWVANAVSEDGSIAVHTENPRTRDAALVALERILEDHIRANRGTLVGFDFPYGYPAGFAAVVRGATGPAWRATWQMLSERIEDGPDNGNNRFAVAAELNQACGLPAGPFWGCPKAGACAHLSSKGHAWSDSPFRAKRHADRRLRVQEVWKLYGIGSVGSQALVGIPYVSRLRRSDGFSAFSRVWPFETGFSSDPLGRSKPAILHAEIWPGVVTPPQDPKRVKDDLQVEALARHFASLDGAGKLGALFDRPTGIDDRALTDCLNEEGWILGAA